MGKNEIRRYLSYLAVKSKVSASTQNQALSAILFLYREVLQMDMDWIDGIVRAKRPVRVPVVLSKNEVRAVLAHLKGRDWLLASLMYSSGLRVMECLRLRSFTVTRMCQQPWFIHVFNRGGQGVKSPLEEL